MHDSLAPWFPWVTDEGPWKPPIRQGVREILGAFGKDVAKSFVIRCDHGMQYVCGDVQQEIAFLGVESSPCFVRVSEGNGCAE